MKYDHPEINNIQEVIEAIDGRDEFIVAVKDGYTVINYVVSKSDTFPEVTDRKSALLRECRGLIFDNATGKVISRRFQKFFNLGEKVEVIFENVDFSKPHHILEKLDGSMITPFVANGEVIWGTKMGDTDVAKPVADFVRTHGEYKRFAGSVLKTGKTPIFEWISRKQRIVLDYPEDNLVLLAIRDNITGHYTPWKLMEKQARLAEIPVVKKFDSETDMAGFIDRVRNHPEGLEGVVIRFEDGHMVKLKTDWYVRIHKAKDIISSERNVAAIILNNELDDLLPVLLEDDKKRVIDYQTRLIDRCNFLGKKIQRSTWDYRKVYTRKEFALKVFPRLNKLWGSLIFRVWEKEPLLIGDCHSVIRTVILSKTSSNKSWDEIKEFMLEGIDYV